MPSLPLTVEHSTRIEAQGSGFLQCIVIEEGGGMERQIVHVAQYEAVVTTKRHFLSTVGLD